jgi:hypothetical protein
MRLMLMRVLLFVALAVCACGCERLKHVGPF